MHSLSSKAESYWDRYSVLVLERCPHERKSAIINATIYQFREIPLAKLTRLFSQSSRSSVGRERATIARLAILFLHVVQLG